MSLRGSTGHKKTLLERYEEHTQKAEGDQCWLWQAARGKKGYGFISIGGHRVKQAHRVAFELFRGPIPDGKCVLHSCDNPPCVRPSHLFLGTQLVNAQDRDAKGRAGGWSRKGEAHAEAKLTEAQVLKIRRVYVRNGGENSGIGLARQYGVSETTIRRIMKRRLWRHI